MESSTGFLAAESRSAPTKEEREMYSECGIAALETDRVAEAYLCFSRLPQNNPAVLFNMALCFMRAEEYERALELLLQARQKMGTLLGALHQAERPAPAALERWEAWASGYLHPMREQASGLYPARAEQQMIRLQVDILSELGRTEELRPLLRTLAGRGYGNVEHLIKKLENR